MLRKLARVTLLQRKLQFLIGAGLVLLHLSLEAQGELQETSYADGQKKERFETIVDDDGNPVRHGSFESWYENGEKAAKGKYADGLEEGRWTFYHATGKKAAFGRYDAGLRTAKWKLFHNNGKKRGEGKYEDGHMSGAWDFWLADGKEVDPANTGSYGFVRQTYPSGAPRAEGVTRNGRPHGHWAFLWESGDPQFEGELVDGGREGSWRFHHEDGAYDPEFLSGTYARNVRTARGETSDDDAIRDGTYELPELAAPTWSSEEEQQRLESLLDRLAGTRGDDREAVMAELLVHRGASVPGALNRIQALDLEDEDDARLARDAYGELLSRLCAGRGFEWNFTGGGQDAAGNELTIQRWYSVWGVTSADPEFWELDAAMMEFDKGISGMSPLFEPAFRTAAPQNVGNAAAGVYAPRFEEVDVDPSVNGAIQNALRWLAAQQQPDGSWDADAWAGDESIGGIERMAYHDIGVTCLAILSFLADGNTTLVGPYSRNVGSGLRWVCAQLSGDGTLESLLPADDLHFDQALVTLALAEASTFSNSRALLAKTRIALDKIQSMRAADGPWSTGQPNTIISAWMIHAVKAAEWAGFQVDDAGYAAAIAYIDEMTEPTQGRIGFNAPGSFPTRTEANAAYPRELSESPTAAGLFTRILLQDMPARERLLAKQIYRLRKVKPRWDKNGHTCDMHYWYFATLTLAQLGGDSWEEWWKPFSRVGVASQRKDGEAAGSWDPIGPWGYVGGRVYSTAMMTMSLLAPSRLQRLSEIEFQSFEGAATRIQSASLRTNRGRNK